MNFIGVNNSCGLAVQPQALSGVSVFGCRKWNFSSVCFFLGGTERCARGSPSHLPSSQEGELVGWGSSGRDSVFCLVLLHTPFHFVKLNKKDTHPAVNQSRGWV